MRRDRELRDSVVHSNLVLADGASIIWASCLRRRPLPERVAGIDLPGRTEVLGRSVYFLGATDKVLGRMLERVAADIHEPGAAYLFAGMTVFAGLVAPTPPDRSLRQRLADPTRPV